MAAACLGTQDVPAAVTGLLADCDGLPFAVEEILAAAVSSGQLREGGPDGWEVNDRTQHQRARFDRRLGQAPGSAGLARWPAICLPLPRCSADRFDWTLLPGIAGAAEADVLAELQAGRSTSSSSSRSSRAITYSASGTA